MRSNHFRLMAGAAVLLLATVACSLFNTTTPTTTQTATRAAPLHTATPLPAPAVTAAPGSQPVQISGGFTYTNDIITTYYVEHAVALVDMHGFVIRDQTWEIPIQSQTLGYAKLDPASKSATYWLQLPEQPAAVFNDVDNNGKTDTGVQIFAVDYWPNLTGGPYSEGDDPTRGWPNYLASVKTDTENKDEVTGGALVVWSPDNNQQFPTGFGADGLLFTKDDPVGPIQAGYSIIDLDQKPFGISREREPNLTLYEPQDVAIKDYSTLSYTEAFDKMFQVVKTEYAFNGIQGKQPEWDKLYAELQPKIQQAQNQKDGYGFYAALVEFTNAFKDGHVGLGGGDYDAQYFQQKAGGGYGFAIRELDDKSVIVTFVTRGGPADKAGIALGDTVTQFDGKPIGQAIGEAPQYEGPQSSDFSLRYQQMRYLLRGPVGQSASVTFEHNGASKTVTLKTVPELDSLRATSLYAGYDPNALPVEYSILPSGIGYVKVRSNYDDLNLVIRLFQRALETFKKQNLTGVIIDMRQNLGGANLGLAGFLTDQTVEMGQLEYYSDKTGKFEAEGPRDKLYPNQEQYRFDHLALLVSQSCFSACELESYGFSQVPGIQIYGEYPTAGVEAEVARGQFQLPDGLSLQIPTGRFTLPDGSIFLEGKGVQPNHKVPLTAQNVLSNQDVVLQTAENDMK